MAVYFLCTSEVVTDDGFTAIYDNVAVKKIRVAKLRRQSRFPTSVTSADEMLFETRTTRKLRTPPPSLFLLVTLTFRLPGVLRKLVP